MASIPESFTEIRVGRTTLRAGGACSTGLQSRRSGREAFGGST